MALDNIYLPDPTITRLPAFSKTTSTTPGLLNDNSDLILNIDLNTLVNVTFTAYVYNVADGESIPTSLESNESLTYSILPGSSVLPYGLQFNSVSNTATITGTVINLSSTNGIYDFVIRATLTGVASSPSTLYVVDKYFYFNTLSTTPELEWLPSWLSSLPTVVVNTITVYDLGSSNKGEFLSINTQISNPNNSILNYSIVSTNNTLVPSNPINILPSGLRINSSGSILGIPSASNDPGIYYFSIEVSDGITTGSPPTQSVVFSLYVTSDVELVPSSSNIVVWITPSGNLGSTYETFASHFGVVAQNNSDQTINYSVAPYSISLPVGLNIDSLSGLILGICPLVNNTVTYTVVIRATVSTNYVDRIFSFTIIPLENNGSYMTVQAPVMAKTRDLLAEWSWMLGQVPDSSVFRYIDTYFGHIKEPMIYIVGGLNIVEGCFDITTGLTTECTDNNPNSRSYFLDKLRDYHRPMDIRLNTLGWSAGYDLSGNYIYDIVYFTLIDPQQGASGFINNAETIVTNPTNSLKNGLPSWNIPVSNAEREFPNSIENCRLDLILTTNRQGQNTNPSILSYNYQQLIGSTPGIGLSGIEAAPLWQSQPTIPNNISTITGWIPVIPLVYVNPGQGTIVTQSLIEIGEVTTLTGLPVTIDRYAVTTTVSTEITFDLNSTETTFDGPPNTANFTQFDEVYNLSGKYIKFPPGNIL